MKDMIQMITYALLKKYRKTLLIVVGVGTALFLFVCALIGLIVQSPFSVFFSMDWTLEFMDEEKEWELDFSQGLNALGDWAGSAFQAVVSFFSTDEYQVFENMSFTIDPEDYEDSYGYEMLLEVLLDMDAAYISNLKQQYPDATGYYGTSTNLVDILKVYSIIIGTDNENPCELTAEHIAVLAMVYERMVLFSVEEISYTINAGDDLGNVYVISEESAYYSVTEGRAWLMDVNFDGTQDFISQVGGVIVDSSWSEFLPLGSCITLDGSVDTAYFVVGYDELDGGAILSICLPESGYDTSNSTYWVTKAVTGYHEISYIFTTNAYYVTGSFSIIREVEVTEEQGGISLLSAEDYVSAYGFNEAQLSYYETFDEVGEEILGEGFTMTYAALFQFGTGDTMVSTALSQIGNVNGEKYWSWWGYSSRVSWCAIFVSWVADQCGYIDMGIIPLYQGCDAGADWFKSEGLWQSRSSGYIPSTGDIIFFGTTADYTHTGIVQYVEGDNVITIEGNSSNQVKECSYSLTSTYIQGYGTPSYPATGEGTLTGSSYEEMVWNYLRSVGFSEEATAGIMGNLEQESGIDPNAVQSSGYAAGICQWENYRYQSARWSKLYTYATGEGLAWTDLKVQLDFMIWELNGGDSTTAYILQRDYGGIGALMLTKDVEWAVEAFEYSFERAGTPNMEKRYAYAYYYLDKFGSEEAWK